MTNRPFLYNETIWFKIFFSIIIYLGCFGIVFALSLLLAIPIFNISLSEIMGRMNNLENPMNVSFLKYIQLCQTLGLFIIPPLLIGFLLTRKPVQYLQFERNFSFNLFILIAFIIFASSPLINYLVLINEKICLPASLSKLEAWMKNSENTAQKLTYLFLDVNTIKGLLFNVFLMGVLPALGEEMSFRGLLQKFLVKWFKNVHAGIILTAIIFSAIHLQFYGFIARFALGLFLGYLFLWTQNIWYPIIAHFMNNTIAVTFYFLLHTGKINVNIDEVGVSNNTGYLVIISIGFVIVLLYGLHRLSKTQLRS